MKTLNQNIQSIKVASSNTLKTRVVASSKKFNRKPKHKNTWED